MRPPRPRLTMRRTQDCKLRWQCCAGMSHHLLFLIRPPQRRRLTTLHFAKPLHYLLPTCPVMRLSQRDCPDGLAITLLLRLAGAWGYRLRIRPPLGWRSTQLWRIRTIPALRPIRLSEPSEPTVLHRHRSLINSAAAVIRLRSPILHRRLPTSAIVVRLSAPLASIRFRARRLSALIPNQASPLP